MSMQHSTSRCSTQPMCHYCKNTGHFKFSNPKLVTATASKTPQKPVALIVSQGRDQQNKEILPVFGCKGIKAGSITTSSVDTSPFPVRSELDLCCPFLCWDTVEIDGVDYPVTVQTQPHSSYCAGM